MSYISGQAGRCCEEWSCIGKIAVTKNGIGSNGFSIRSSFCIRSCRIVCSTRQQTSASRSGRALFGEGEGEGESFI